MTTSRMQRFLLMLALLVAPVAMMLGCGGNATAPAVAQTYNPAPAVVIISGATSATATGPVTFTFTFSQPVTTFPVSAVNVTGGTAAASTTRVSANQYTLIVTPPTTGTGNITLTVAIGAFSSAAGVPNAVAASVTQPYGPSGGGGGGATAPTAGAPAPSLAAANVLSLYTSSNHYTNIPVGNWNPAWGQGGSIAPFAAGTANVWLMNLVNYQGINISSPDGKTTDTGVLDITGKSTLHISYWTANGTKFNFYPINAATDTYAIDSGTLTHGAWTDLELPITQAGFDLTTIRQLKFDTTTAEVIYLDNIYFHGSGGGATAPTVAITGTTGSAVTAPVTLTFTFSTDVGTSFTASDVLVTNGTAAATVTKVDATHYTLVVTPPANSTGTMLINVPAGAFNDVATSQANTVAANASQAYNTTGAASVAVPTTVPPTPTPTAGSSVIKLLSSVAGGFVGSTVSDKSANIDTWLAGWSGGTGGAEFPITEGSKTARPRAYVMGAGGASYVGIEFIGTAGANEIDISAMTHFHVDVWTPDDAANLQFKLQDAGADKVPDQSLDIWGVATLTPGSTPALATGQWLSYDIPITTAGFANNTFVNNNASGIQHLAQIVIVAPVAGGHVYIDNLYFWGPSGGGGGGTATAPTTGAGAPSVAAANVLSLYTSSNTYTNIPVDNWNPGWGQSGSMSDFVAGSATVKKLDLVAPNAYQGVAISSNGGDAAGTGVLNITGKTTLHISYWTANGTKFNFYPINATAEVAIDSGTLTQGAWTDLELTVPSSFDPTTIRQIKFDTTTAEVIYLDNIYFHAASSGGGGTATVPTVGAGAPSVAAANVISLYNSSHAYTDVTVNDWNPNWGQNGSLSDFVAGSATVKKLDLVAPNAYQGVAISSNGGDAAGTGVLNITGKTTLHISYWTANGSKFNFYPINATAEVAIDSGTLSHGVWTDLELAVPSGFNPTTIRQIKFDTATAEVIYMDNIYFH